MKITSRTIAFFTLLLFLEILFAFPIAGFSVSSEKNETLEKKDRQYYIINFFYSAKKNVLKLNDNFNKNPISIGEVYYTRDSGSGSQFYAQVINSKGEAEKIQDGSDRFYLGEWEMRLYWDGIDEQGNMTGGAKEIDGREVTVSVPYFPDGQTVNIYEAKTDRLALCINVSQFSKPYKQSLTSSPKFSVSEPLENEEKDKEKEKRIPRFLMIVLVVIFSFFLVLVIYRLYRKADLK